MQESDRNKKIDVTLRRRAIQAMRLSSDDQNETFSGMIMLLYGYRESLRREEFVKLLCS